jgi:hypothetical protein
VAEDVDGSRISTAVRVARLLEETYAVVGNWEEAAAWCGQKKSSALLAIPGAENLDEWSCGNTRDYSFYQ